MTYLNFLLLFVALPALVLLGFTIRARTPIKRYLFVLGLAVIAFVYATPWDNYLVWRGVWDYGNDRVVGTIGYVPIEEYMFFVIQVVLTGFWTLAIVRKWGMRELRPERPRSYWAEGIGYGLLGIAGLIAFTKESGLYFALIAVWSAPVCLFQWWFSPRYLAQNRRLLAASIIPTSLYLCCADWYAIKSGIWSIADATRSGIEFFGLPFEEALFFTITNVMVVQGLLLLLEREGRGA